MKNVVFLGNSLDAIRSLPIDVRRTVGFQIERLQIGLDPRDWKPIKIVGPGVREIRIRDAAGAFRVIYVATFPDAVFVLHAFAKKSQATAHDIATKRFKELMKSRT